MGVSVPSQIPRWHSNSGPPDQNSDVQPLEAEKHAQLAGASYNTQSSRMPLLHIYIYIYVFYVNIESQKMFNDDGNCDRFIQYMYYL